jgi:hypothetical protein
VELYLHSPIRLHGVLLSKAQGQLYLNLYLYFYRDLVKTGETFSLSSHAKYWWEKLGKGKVGNLYNTFP